MKIISNIYEYKYKKYLNKNKFIQSKNDIHTDTIFFDEFQYTYKENNNIETVNYIYGALSFRILKKTVNGNNHYVYLIGDYHQMEKSFECEKKTNDPINEKNSIYIVDFIKKFIDNNKSHIFDMIVEFAYYDLDKIQKSFMDNLHKLYKECTTLDSYSRVKCHEKYPNLRVHYGDLRMVQKYSRKDNLNTNAALLFQKNNFENNIYIYRKEIKPIVQEWNNICNKFLISHYKFVKTFEYKLMTNYKKFIQIIQQYNKIINIISISEKNISDSIKQHIKIDIIVPHYKYIDDIINAINQIKQLSAYLKRIIDDAELQSEDHIRKTFEYLESSNKYLTSIILTMKNFDESFYRKINNITDFMIDKKGNLKSIDKIIYYFTFSLIKNDSFKYFYNHEYRDVVIKSFRDNLGQQNQQDYNSINIKNRQGFHNFDVMKNIYSEIEILIFDYYVLSRMFKTYDNTDYYGIYQQDIKNAIIVAGDRHIQNIYNALISMDYELLFQNIDDNDVPKKCLYVGDNYNLSNMIAYD